MSRAATATRLDWQLLAAAPAGTSSHWLGGAVVGAANTPGVTAPMLQVPVTLLGTVNPTLWDLWSSSAPCRSGVAQGIHYACDGTVLYGVVQIKPDSHDLLALSEDAYSRLFALLQELGYPCLWRVWNYLPHINAESAGLEHYRQFNVGRQNAFVRYGQVLQGSVPAACALGLGEGALSIAFMAGRVSPLYLENPRQVSAYEYPSAYGPRSPTFSRAVLVPLPEQEILFISGTASIVGHETVHRGDVAEQTSETLRNICTLLDQAGRVAALPYTLAELHYRVYIRHAEDLTTVQAVLQQAGVPAESAVYILADVCRSDLLVEIEAMSLRDRAVEGHA